MYVCDSCGCIFTQPQQHREYREYWGGGCWESVSGCPCCGGGYMEVNEDEQEQEDDFMPAYFSAG